MADGFIAKSGNDVTDKFMAYLRPLLGNDMAEAYRLQAPPVAKILKKKK